MAAETLSGDAFSDDAFAEAELLLEEIDRSLSRSNGTEGVIVTDRQTERVLRVLRILSQQLQQLRRDVDGEEGTIVDGGIPGPFVDNDGNLL